MSGVRDISVVCMAVISAAASLALTIKQKYNHSIGRAVKYLVMCIT